MTPFTSSSFATNLLQVNKSVKVSFDPYFFKNVDKETITTKSVTTKTSGSIRNNVACPICDLPFMSEEIMKLHMTAVHQKVKKYQATPLATTSKTLIVSHKTRKLILQKKEI